MKSLKILLNYCFTLIFLGSNLWAQDAELNLTETQKVLHKALKSQREANKKVFLEVLSEDQKKIYNDNTIDKSERRKRIHKSLTDSQKEALSSSRLALKNARKEFRASLTEAQKEILKNRFPDHLGEKFRENKVVKRQEAHANKKDFSKLTNLTPEQKQMLEINRVKIITNRKAFRSTFTSEQMLIANDKSLDRRKKKEALRASFSESQIQQYEANKEEIKKWRNEFTQTLTPAQKKQLRNL